MWYKGIKIILDAMKILQDNNQQFLMLFVGDGLERDEIEEYAKTIGVAKNCMFIGAISDRDKLKAINSRCDLFLFPSTFDTNGIVVREAASSGLASMLVKDSCAAEDTIDKQNCLWIDENAESMAATLFKVGSNLEYLHQLGKAAEEQLYISWDQSIEAAVTRYQEVIAKFEYDKPKPFDDNSSFTDVAFSLYGELINKLEKSYEHSKELKEYLKERADRWL